MSDIIFEDPNDNYADFAGTVVTILKIAAQDQQEADQEDEDDDDSYDRDYFTDNGDRLTISSHGGGFLYDVNHKPTAGTVSSFTISDGTGYKMTVTGFAPVDAITFYDSVILANQTARANYLISLLDDNTTATGLGGADYFEVGAGNDTVTAGGGNDFVAKFKSGDLDFVGGTGSDTLSFGAEIGTIYPTAYANQLNIDLRNGSGTDSPYGGTITFSSVENVIGTDNPLGDIIKGNDDPNMIGDGRYDTGPDHIETFGGNDIVKIAFFSHDVIADGGAGTDLLQFSLATGTHTLDLGTPANNTGYFAGSTFTNFEIFKESTDSNGSPNFIFRGTDSSQTITSNVGLVSHAIIQFKGGNDRVDISAFNNGITADGGAGTDTLAFYENFTGILDLTNQAHNTGTFAHGHFTGFEIFRSLNTFSTSDSIDFRGDGAANTVFGGMGTDKISLGGGNDVANGGGSGDTLTGGAGRDTLTGGVGVDVFDFNATSESKGATRDLITDFSVGNNHPGGADDDLIDLRTIDAKKGPGNQLFTFIGAQKFHHKAGELHILHKSGLFVVEGDTDGNGLADFQIAVHSAAALTKADFLL